MNPAFAYVYDEFLSERRYERDLALFENELATRGITGRIARLAVFRNAKELVTDLIRAGVKNVVFVGNDQTLQKNMWFLPDMDVTVGYVPMDDTSEIGPLLGLPPAAASAEVLAARLVDTLDVGRIAERYFLTQVIMPTAVAALEIEGRYRVQPAVGGAIAIRNLGRETRSDSGPADPHDGLLEAVIQARPEPRGLSRLIKAKDLTETRIPFSHGTVISDQPFDAYVDGHVMNGSRFEVTVVPKVFKIITGRKK